MNLCPNPNPKLRIKEGLRVGHFNPNLGSASLAEHAPTAPGLNALRAGEGLRTIGIGI